MRWLYRSMNSIDTWQMAKETEMRPSTVSNTDTDLRQHDAGVQVHELNRHLAAATAAAMRHSTVSNFVRHRIGIAT
jgi:hypothetical protein